MREQFKNSELQAMNAIKSALDPNEILNPGKIFDVFKPWDQKKVDATLPWEVAHEEPQTMEK